NAITLILVTAWIIWEAVGRFQHPQPVQPLVMFPAAAIGIVVNLVIGFGLRREGDNLNMRAAALHVFGDVGASIAVIVAGGIIWKTGWYPADPILSLGIALLIAWGAWRILRETTSILLEAVPEEINLSALVRDIMRVKGVYDVHDLHVWSITGGMPALSCHTCIDDLSLGQSISTLKALETMLQQRYHIRHTTIQFEYHAHHETYCAVDSLHCQITPLAMPHDHEHEHEHEHQHEHEHKHEPGIPILPSADPTGSQCSDPL
ncbi:MAG: cation transporter, partial [Ktedonobacteraceae bacterium]|nr:cation transporter [Ktedonobacteraceae bacterium]